MPITQSRFSVERDLDHLLAFLASERAQHGPCGFLHMGDVIWRFFTPTSSLAVDLSETVGIWRSGHGIVAAAFCWLPDESAEIMVSQTAYDPEVESAAFQFAAETFRKAGRPKLMLGCGVERHQRRETLRALGFTRGPERLDMLHTMVPPDVALTPPKPASGYALCDTRNLPVPLESFLAGRPHDPGRYRAMMTRPEYRAELDISMFLGDERAGFCIGWLDPRNRTGLLEPVGVSDEHRRRGVGTCIIAEVVRRLFALGTERIYVAPYPSNEPAMRLYQKVGFRPVVLDETWSLTL